MMKGMFCCQAVNGRFAIETAEGDTSDVPISAPVPGSIRQSPHRL